jgi:hypothetical protein
MVALLVLVLVQEGLSVPSNDQTCLVASVVVVVVVVVVVGRRKAATPSSISPARC